MSIQLCVILFSILFGLACTARLEQPADAERLERKTCIDYTFYAKYICKSRRNGEKIPVPGKCFEYLECWRGESIKKFCKNFFDFKMQQCTSVAVQCIELDDKDCVKPTTSPPCTTVTPVSPTACTCPDIPTTTTRRYCPKSTPCRPPTCSTVFVCSCPVQVTCRQLTTTTCPPIPPRKD